MLAGYGHLLRAADRLRWDEAELDLSADAAAWPTVASEVRDPLRSLVAGFCVAEHAVAEQLAPFEARAGDLELAACFAAQADDERRHARFFSRVAREVMAIDPQMDAERLAGVEIVDLFRRLLPEVAGGLGDGDRGLPEAVSLYHLVLEGLVFHVGQQAALELLDRAGTLPGIRDGVARVQADERWHVGLGVRCLADCGLDGQATEEVLASAAAAAGAWGPEIVAPELVAAALDQHRRRLLQAADRRTSSSSKAGGRRRQAPPDQPAGLHQPR